MFGNKNSFYFFQLWRTIKKIKKKFWVIKGFIRNVKMIES